MYKKLISYLKPLLKPLLLLVLVLGLSLGQANDAFAASRGGGRIGGGSFRSRAPMPSRGYSSPRSYAPPMGGGGYYPGGGFGFPFIAPTFFIGGGGSLVTILVFFAIASFLVQTFRRSQGEGSDYDAVSNPTVSVARLQVGLLANARELQADLDKLAASASTGSTEGLAQVLQETTLALLRHPEYWTHANSTVQQSRLASAEAEFNRLALSERSKFSRETLSNVNNQLQQAPLDALLAGSDAGSLATQELKDPGEFIVVTLVVGAQGSLKLPAVNNPEDLRQALTILGGVASDRLLALEVLWTPQAEGDVLTRDDLLVEYPSLKLV